MPQRMSVCPVPIQPPTPLGIIVGSEHQDPPQRLSINILVNADALAVTELDLDQAASLPGRHRRWGFNRSEAFGGSRGDLNRGQARSRRSDNREASPPPPREHQTRRNAVPPRDFRHHRAAHQRLPDDPHLIVARPATATLNPAQNLYPHQPTIRLALKPDARRKPVTEQGGLLQRDTRRHTNRRRLRRP